MKQINVHEAKSKLSAILADIEKGESYLICRNGYPIADLVPHKKSLRSEINPVLSDVKILYNPAEDLTEDEWGED